MILSYPSKLIDTIGDLLSLSLLLWKYLTKLETFYYSSFPKYITLYNFRNHYSIHYSFKVLDKYRLRLNVHFIGKKKLVLEMICGKCILKFCGSNWKDPLPCTLYSCYETVLKNTYPTPHHHYVKYDHRINEKFPAII